MALAIYSVFVLQVVGILFGIYNEVAPKTWLLNTLPRGMGLALTLISATMAVVVLTLELERRDRKRSPNAELLREAASRVSVCMPFHERDFYRLWPEQVRRARDTVDVTNLSPRPPQLAHGVTEGEHFLELAQTYKDSTAHVRRVERLTLEKKQWIIALASKFSGMPNVSLAVLKDRSNTELLGTLSICRVDNQYAWLVAMAEHDSTGEYRDIMLTGSETVDLVREYFQKRVWSRSVKILERGRLRSGWEEELQS